MLSRVKLTNAHTDRGRPTLKNNTECFRNGLVRELKGKQTKLSRHSMTPGNAEGVGRYFSAPPRIISLMASGNAAKTKR